VTPRRSSHVQRCTPADAQGRLRNARKFLEVAELLTDEGQDPEYSSPSASLAVLAGIASADAACCHALGHRSRGQDHRDASGLVKLVEPGGVEAAKALNRLLDVKDEAQYGLYALAGQDLKSALRQGRSLLRFAEEVTRR
jgi:hypothetical protein